MTKPGKKDQCIYNVTFVVLTLGSCDVLIIVVEVKGSIYYTIT